MTNLTMELEDDVYKSDVSQELDNETTKSWKEMTSVRIHKVGFIQKSGYTDKATL